MLSEEQYAARIAAATVLRKPEFDEIDALLRQGDKEVADDEVWCHERTRLELFYRAPTTATLLAIDERGKHRLRANCFSSVAHVLAETPLAMLRTRLDDRVKSATVFRVPPTSTAEIPARIMFIREEHDERWVIACLLSLTPLIKDGRLNPDATLATSDLDDFVRVMRDAKAIIENVLFFEVRKDVGAKPIRQLNEILRLIGQRAKKLPGRNKQGKVVTYRYQLDADRLNQMETLTATRRASKAWPALYQRHGWDQAPLDPWHESHE
jgi:hypothetical protein